MNERIKELEKLCWDNQTNHLNVKKFAQLLINECCTMMIDLESKYPVNLTVREIKHNFGIEE